MSGEEIAGRLLMSALFGTLVGIERQWRHKNAGLKTNALVSVGATSFGLIALGSFGPGGNPTQIAAGVTGIGFIHLNLHFVTFVIAGDIGRIETD